MFDFDVQTIDSHRFDNVHLYRSISVSLWTEIERERMRIFTIFGHIDTNTHTHTHSSSLASSPVKLHKQ